MIATAMKRCRHDSPATMICDPHGPDAPTRGTQNALQAIGDRRAGPYHHPKRFPPIVIRACAALPSSAKISAIKTHRAYDNDPQIRDAAKRPQTMLVTSP
jgi:hypothetical protein